MLISIRDKITGWIGWVLIIVIGLAFSLFGLNYYLQRDIRAYAAKVGGEEISLIELDRAYQRRLRQMREVMGDGFDINKLDEAALRRSTLDQLIENEVLIQAARDEGFTVDDATVATEIQLMPAFQEGGRFSVNRYDQLLRTQGITRARFESDVRRSILINQFLSGLWGTEILLDRELKKIWSIEGQQRNLDYLTIPWRNFHNQVEISEDEIKLYYDKSADQYREPEQVKLEYLVLSADALGADILISEEEISQLYQDVKNTLGRPEERRARHILIAVPGDADETAVAEARKRAEDIEKNLRDGQPFADLAKQFSDDPGSKEQGGDLGFFGKGAMIPGFEKVVFKQNIGDISEPIRTEFGFHIIELMDIRPADIPSLDEVRDQLVQEEKHRRGVERMYDELDILANLVFEHPDSLQPAADKLDLSVQETAWFTRKGGKGIASGQAVIDAAFSDDVLLDGNNSEPLELDNDRVVVVRVKDHRESRLQALKTVRKDIEQLLQRQRAQSRARDEGLAALQRLRDGASLEDIAAQRNLSLTSAGFVDRNTPTQDVAIISEAFKLPAPAEHAPSYGGVELGSGDYALLRVTAAKDGNIDSLSEERVKDLRRRYLRLYDNYERRALIDNLKQRAKIILGRDAG